MIGVVLNPNASGARSPELPRRLRKIVGDLGEVVETRTPEQLDETIARFATQGVDVLATCGGDGTNLSTVTQMVRHYGEAGLPLPRLAILRGGTVNTVAENLKIEGKPDQILGSIVARLRQQLPPKEIGQDLLEVNGMYGFLFAAAMGARFLEAYYGGPTPGVAWATVLAARTIGSLLIPGGGGKFARWLFDPIPCEIIADGETLALRAVRLLLASVVPDVGIGMKVTWQAGMQPNRFHLIASAMPTMQMGRQAARVLGGRPLEGQPHVDRLVQRLEVRWAETQSYTLDGDLFREKTIRIAMGPRIWVLKP